jgi:site-specific DNA-methyltransferase (adenine-specific)
MHPEQLTAAIDLYCGDCIAVLTTLADNSVDSVVTDPPYHLTTGKQGGTGDASLNLNSPAGRSRISTGFMGKVWDGGDIAFRPELWRGVFRVMKPGAHLLAFGGTRTYHRMACAIEDAGFEVRDCIQWIYGSGFPKSLNVSKAIDKEAGAEREVVGPGTRHNSKRCAVAHGDTERLAGGIPPITAPATDAAREWQGWGTALKPACELIVLARKPLSEGTVVANVLKWGTGAINIDACRIGDFAGCRPLPYGRDGEASANRRYTERGSTNFAATPGPRGGSPAGRWPANIITDGSDEVVGAFPAESKSGGSVVSPPSPKTAGIYGDYARDGQRFHGHADNGSAARFFYTSKADGEDRLGSKHPTVKPVDLIQHLVRLVTPPGGTVLDCFAGTGTTGEAAWREGMRAILIERESEYQDDIRRRMKLAMAGPAERKRETAREKHKGKPVNLGPLFGGN